MAPSSDRAIIFFLVFNTSNRSCNTKIKWPASQDCFYIYRDFMKLSRFFKFRSDDPNLFVKSLESQGQPVYATLNTVRNQGNENQPIRNGPIRLSIPKSGTTTAKIVTNNRTYQGGNVVSQPIRVQLRQPSNQNSGQSSNQGGSSGTRTIIQTVQMPRSQQQAQRNRFFFDSG